MDYAPMAMTDPSPTTAPVRPTLTHVLTAGLVGGIAATGLSLGMAARMPGPHWSYGVSVGFLATSVLSLAVTACVAVGLLAGRGAGRVAGTIVGMAPVVAAFLWLNASLFDGVWIRSRPWAPVAEWGFRIVGTLGLLLIPKILNGLRARGFLTRFVVAGVLGAGALVAARCDQERFAAYPDLKIQFAFLMWALPATAVWCLLSTWKVRPAVGLVLLAALAGGAVPLAAKARVKYATLERARTVIITKPCPGLVRALPSVESFILDRINPMPSTSFDDLPAVSLEPDIDQSALKAALSKVAGAKPNFNVLMIAIDAMRADHMTCEGYGRPTTPNLDKLAAKSSWFRRAVAPVPASSMGYSSTFSGLYARVTPAYGLEFGVKYPVPDGFMLPEIMKATGRSTMGVTAFHPAVQNAGKFKILEKGFEVFNPVKTPEERTGEEVTNMALDMLAKRKPNAPFFLWMHMMEPHAPYHFHVGRDFGRRPIDAYDSEIAEADAQVARVLEYLHREKLEDSTIVVVFGDHGEGFGEHNNREHGSSLYDHQVRVPLLIHVPKVAPKEIKEWVTLADVTPTLLHLLNVEGGAARMGRNLLPLMLGTRATWPDFAYSERAASASKVPRSWERAVWSGNHKLIWLPHDRTYQFYDLEKDPGEENNLWDPADPLARRLLAMMRTHDARIDATWGAASAGEGGGEAEPIDVRFGRLVDRVVKGDGAEVDKALDAIITILNSDAILLDSTKQDRLGSRDITRLLVHGRSVLPGLAPDSERRADLTRFIMFADKQQDVALLKAEREKTSSGDLRLRVAHWLAVHGDASGKGDLELALKVGPLEARITAAAGLAALKDHAGVEFLDSMLDVEHVGRLRESIFGLAFAGEASPLRLQNATMRGTLSNAWVQGALLEAAVRAPASDDVTASLLQLTRSNDPRVAKEAKAEFETRVPKERLVRSRHVLEALEGIRSALLYGDAKLAAGFFKDLSATDDPFMGSGWWLGVRAARSLGDADLLAKCGARWLDVQRRQGVKGLAPESLQGMAGEVPVGPPCRVEVAGDWMVPLLDRGRLFSTTMKITNTTGVKLMGGECPDAFVLEWRYTAADGKIQQGARLVQTRLPEGGLAPGASCTLLIPGMFPDRPGQWVPVLVATREWGGKRDDVVFTAPAVTLK